MIRWIVMSATYQQSSASRPDLEEVDPGNRLLARQNRYRVEAEVLRDIALQTAGLLSRKIGGPSVFPPLPAVIAQQTYAGSFKFEPSQGEDRYRRGLYTFFRRTAIDPNLLTFDCPDSSMSRPARDRSNNPLQALATLQNEVFHEAAQALAGRLIRLSYAGGLEDQERLRHAFEIAVSRPPDAHEENIMLDLLTAARDYYGGKTKDAQQLVGNHAVADISLSQQAAWVTVSRAVLNLDEFLTRE